MKKLMLIICMLSTGSLAWAQAPPLSNDLQSFAVLGGSTVTNTGATIVTGNLGVSPGTAITGFPPGTVTGGTFHNIPPATSAHGDLITAFTALSAPTHPCPPANNLTGMDLGTLPAPLTPGVYCFNSSAQLTGKLTLQGNAADVWIFQIKSTLTTATNASVVMSGGGQDTNVYWVVGSSATIGTGTAFTGNILAQASITLTTGASVSGRALAIDGAVTMDTNNVASRCSSGPCPQPLPFPRIRDVTQLLIDHYECYKAKPDDKFDRHNVRLEDQFGVRTVTVKDAQLICTPVVKNGEFPDDLRNTIDHLVCYDIRAWDKEGDKEGDKEEGGKRGDKEGTERRDVLVDNQFGLRQPLTVARPQLLCVPSLKTLNDRNDKNRDDKDKDKDEDHKH
jgi:hypothetical protein